MEKKTIVVGMSGGVDSSVCAALLKEQGHNVIGVFMKNWEEKTETGGCHSEADFQDVVKVASKLQIPYYSVNFTKQYREQVFEPFLQGLKKGDTPNPDILCNSKIKFGLLMDEAIKLGADLLATGHYAQNVHDSSYHLMKGADPGKDQTYFLYMLKQDVLQKVIFPVGGMQKKEVRDLARKFELPTSEKKDSTGLCYIGERDFTQFIHNFIPYQPGNFEMLSGKIVGQHKGIAFYTIGQRSGMGLGGEGEPWFVVGKDPQRNVVFVERGTEHPALYAETLIASSATWIAGHAPKLPYSCTAKIRYRQQDQACTIEKEENGKLFVRFSSPQRAITPSQSIVFYQGNECLGGAIIENP